MNRAIGIISSNYHPDFLQGLAQDRPIAAVPFGGRYRLLDFILSGMVNSGLRTVGIITPHHYRAMLDHLGAGKEWFLDRKRGGLFILPCSKQGLLESDIKYSLRDLSQNLEFLERDYAENVILSGCNQVININFKEILAYHRDKKADVTLIYKDYQTDWPGNRGSTVIATGKDGTEVIGISEETGQTTDSQCVKVFTDMIIIKRTLLLEIIEGYRHLGHTDLLDAIKENLESFKVEAYPFEGYLGRINSVADYFRYNMELLLPQIQEELFRGEHRIHTKIKDNPPTKYGSKVAAQNSLISSGCNIEGKIENSIISRGVEISEGAHVKNSIVMQRCRIGAGAQIENVILDKFAYIRDNAVIKGKSNAPVVINKKAMV